MDDNKITIAIGAVILIVFVLLVYAKRKANNQNTLQSELDSLNTEYNSAISTIGASQSQSTLEETKKALEAEYGKKCYIDEVSPKEGEQLYIDNNTGEKITITTLKRNSGSAKSSSEQVDACLGRIDKVTSNFVKIKNSNWKFNWIQRSKYKGQLYIFRK